MGGPQRIEAARLELMEMQAKGSRENSRSGMTVSAVSEWVDRFLNEYNANVPLRFIVAQNQEDIYGVENSREAIGQKWQGSYHPTAGIVTLIASNLDNEEACRRTIRHEVLAHYGLNTFKSEEKMAFLAQVLETRNERSLNHVWKMVDYSYRNEPEIIKAEEVFAFVAEEERSFFGVGWDKVRTGFQRILRESGLSSGPLKDFELRESARLLAKGIKTGLRVQQIFPRDDNSQFSKVVEIQPQFTMPERAAWGNFPEVIRNNDLKTLEREPEYAAAKAGDRGAALSLIDRVLTDQTVDQVRSLIGTSSKVRIVPVIAEEASGRNKLPLMMAQVLADRLGAGVEVEYDICQTNRVHRTGSTSDHRLAFSPSFAGDVTPGRAYILVDDTLAMGGTIAALHGYIANRGGNVIGAAVMTAHEGALHLPVKEEMLNRIKAKHGDAMGQYWKEEFGYDIDKLTNAEAGHLRAAASVDALRARISAARDAVRRAMGGKAVGPQENGAEQQEGLTLPGLDAYRDSQVKRASSAYESASEAFWSTGDVLPMIYKEIIDSGINPDDILRSGQHDARKLQFLERVNKAVAASGEAQINDKTLRHARRHLDKQLKRGNEVGHSNIQDHGDCSRDI